MKKLFISVPMRNRTEYAIKASMEQMHKIAEAVFGEELEVIPTYFEDDPPENTNMALWYLGESIKKLCRKQIASSAFTMRTRAIVAASSRISLQRTTASRPIW